MWRTDSPIGLFSRQVVIADAVAMIDIATGDGAEDRDVSSFPRPAGYPSITFAEGFRGAQEWPDPGVGMRASRRPRAARYTAGNRRSRLPVIPRARAPCRTGSERSEMQLEKRREMGVEMPSAPRGEELFAAPGKAPRYASRGRPVGGAAVPDRSAGGARSVRCCLTPDRLGPNRLRASTVHCGRARIRSVTERSLGDQLELSFRYGRMKTTFSRLCCHWVWGAEITFGRRRQTHGV